MRGHTPGLVSLVGAGPGHPDHLTLKGLRRLQRADIVFHDALVTREVLALATGAEWVDVGKRASEESTAQRSIVAALLEASRRGLRVVRLKGGDSFVFGRGSEEALALEAAGAPFEIVPGVSAAIAAPALSGIPVTHRGISSALLVITGSNVAEFRRITSSVAPESVTIVVMMALRTREDVAGALLDAGWSPSTPAAIILGASLANQFTWRGPLADLAAADLPSSGALPGTLVIGAVASLPIRLVNGVPDLAEVVS
jgi:uroporphyrin-III C-methyltransferase/precorrin-2 dehydrogenase/sirohydrochlorin ferrochelatase